MTTQYPEKKSQTLRILLADDSLVHQRLISGQLIKQGHDVTVVSNGSAALAALQATTFDLVLMDIEMPEMNGLDATRRIRQWEEEGRHVPICAMTTIDDRELCLSAGMDEHLTKPVQAEVLEGTIRRLAEVYAASVEPRRHVEFRSRRILVADDDRVIRETVRSALESRGHLVILAEDGRQALAMIEQQRPDLVLLDLIMPGCSGLAVLQRLAATSHTALPVIVLTGDRNTRHEATAARLGAGEFLHKPIEMDHLVQTIQRHLAEVS